jgi:hypothetical protein
MAHVPPDFLRDLGPGPGRTSPVTAAMNQIFGHPSLTAPSVGSCGALFAGSRSTPASEWHESPVGKPDHSYIAATADCPVQHLALGPRHPEVQYDQRIFPPLHSNLRDRNYSRRRSRDQHCQRTDTAAQRGHRRASGRVAIGCPGRAAVGLASLNQ